MSNCYDCGARLSGSNLATYVTRDGFLSVPVCDNCHNPGLPDPDHLDILWQARPWADERSAL